MKESVNVRMLRDVNRDLNKQDIERVDKDILYSVCSSVELLSSMGIMKIAQDNYTDSDYQANKCRHEVMISQSR